MEVISDYYFCLVDVLSRVGRLYEVYNVLNKMFVKVIVKVWGVFFGVCRIYGDLVFVEIVGRVLFEIGFDNVVNYVLLVRIYVNVGRYEELMKLRREMKERCVRILLGSSWV